MGILRMIGETGAPARRDQCVADLSHHLAPPRRDVERRVTAMPPQPVTDALLALKVIPPTVSVILAVVIGADQPLVVAVVDVSKHAAMFVGDRGLRAGSW